MKTRKVNLRGDAVRHLVSHATSDVAPGKTYACRASVSVLGSKIVYRWRIFNTNGKVTK